MVQTFYICRHAARQDWISGEPGYSPITGHWHDTELSAAGNRQAADLGSFLAGQGNVKQGSTVILSSPYFRCLETAAPLCKELGVDLVVEGGLSEWFTVPAPGTGSHAQTDPLEYPDAVLPAHVDRSYRQLLPVATAGETIDQLHARSRLLADKLVDQIEEQYNGIQTIVIFTHAALVISLGQALVHDENLNITAWTAGCSRYQRAESTLVEPPDDVYRVDWHSRIDFLSDRQKVVMWTFADYWRRRTRPNGTFTLDKGQPLAAKQHRTPSHAQMGS